MTHLLWCHCSCQEVATPSYLRAPSPNVQIQDLAPELLPGISTIDEPLTEGNFIALPCKSEVLFQTASNQENKSERKKVVFMI